jgi:hypothetical protein
MKERIILSLVSIIILVLTLKKGDKQTIFLTSGLTIGILITWINMPVIIIVGLLIYMLTSIMIAINSLRRKELSILNQLTITLSGICAFGTTLFSVMQWPFAGEIRLISIIPIIFYIISLRYGMTKRKEIGYLTIMNVEFVLRLIRLQI